MNKKIKLILSVAICMFLIASSFNATGNTSENDETSLTENTGEIINKQIIAVPDSSILLTLWDGQLSSGEIVPYYSISLDGGQTVVRIVQPSYEIGLRYAHFDPLEWVPIVEPLLAANVDTHLFLVQFITQPLEVFEEAITAFDGMVYHYVAQYAYLVEMSDEVKRQVEGLPYIRWIGPYHPAYRLEEFMLDNLENAEQMYPLQRYNIQVHAIEQKNIVANRIISIGGTVNRADAGKFLVEATLTPEQLFSAVRWDEVNFVDRWSPYEVDMDIAREIGGANYIESVDDYNGTGVRGEVFDNGFNLNHVDFQSRPLVTHGTVGSASHGASTSGICFGDGTGNAQARGLLPEGQGIVADYNTIGVSGPSRYTHTGELVQDPYFAVFQTASVGSSRTTQYTTISAETDQALFDFDIVHCQSQSNAGDQMSRPQAWAKNIISGGGIYHYNTLDRSDDMWNRGASTGSASDGRIKPTFTFFYDNILTTSSDSPTAYTSSFGGTSGATPIIAGYVGLFFQMWADGIFGNEVNHEGTVFENRAHMTTAKAMLINTAYQYPFTGTSHDKTRMHQGWGMPDVGSLYDLREKIYVIDETVVLEPFDVGQHIVSVEIGEPEIKVTMAYADPPGPEPGAWTVEVHADEIIQDSHVETPELDADYALVVSPVVPGPYSPEITGPAYGEIKKQYEFTIVTTDPSDEDLYYWIEWGDGTVDEWFGPYASGEIATASHAWNVNGTYFIRGRAKNAIGAEGDWSGSMEICIINAPVLEIDNITGGLFKISAVIKNNGSVDAMGVDWSITLNDGFIPLGKKTKGRVINIPAGENITVRSMMIIGLGKTRITVTAECVEGSSDTKIRNAFVFLSFIRI